jgi:LacI family transcriptional regulator
VLNDHHTSVRISEETRQRVLAAAEELGYRTNHMARAVRTGNTQMLGFIGGDLREEQVGCMLVGALDEADQNGYTLKILPHHDREDDAQQMIRRSSELRLMGVVALHLPAWMLEQLYAEAQQCKYPLVLMDSRAPLEGVYQVASDDERGVGMAIDHLVKLGHHNIAMMSSDLISPLIPLREVAYRTAMESHGFICAGALCSTRRFPTARS